MQIFPALVFIFLVVLLGINNSSNGKNLPSSITNCTADVTSLDIGFLHSSVRIFGGIYIVVTILTVVYQVVTIALRFLAVDLVERYRKFLTYLVG